MSVIYDKSEKLNNLDYKYDTDTGIVTVKDLKTFMSPGYVEYSRSECEIIKKTTGEITMPIHMIKKHFAAEITGGYDVYKD